MPRKPTGQRGERVHVDREMRERRQQVEGGENQRAGYAAEKKPPEKAPGDDQKPSDQRDQQQTQQKTNDKRPRYRHAYALLFRKTIV